MGSLTAGGFKVHKTTPLPEEERRKRTQGTSVLERYQDLAAAMHRTAISPRDESSYVWGCSCGDSGIIRDQGYRTAQLMVAKHTLEEAQKLHDKLEGKLDG